MPLLNPPEADKIGFDWASPEATPRQVGFVLGLFSRSPKAWYERQESRRPGYQEIRRQKRISNVEQGMMNVEVQKTTSRGQKTEA